MTGDSGEKTDKVRKKTSQPSSERRLLRSADSSPETKTAVAAMSISETRIKGTTTAAGAGIRNPNSVFLDLNIKSIMSGVRDMQVQVARNSYVYHVKTAIYELCDILPEKQLLLYEDRELLDEKPLDAYGIQDDNLTITLSVKLSSGLPLHRSQDLLGQKLSNFLLTWEPKLFRREGLRKKISTMGPTMATKDKKTTATLPPADEATEKTRERMRKLLEKKGKRQSSAATTPTGTDSDSAVSSSCVSPGLTSVVSCCSQEDIPPTDRELRHFFETSETQQDAGQSLRRRNNRLVAPPQDDDELEKLRQSQLAKARTNCRLCGRGLNATEQNMPCHCRRYFCRGHREPGRHRCSIDYKQTARNRLAKKMVYRRQSTKD